MLINFLNYSILSLVLSSNPSEMNIVETAVSNDNFSTLVAAVQAGDLVGALSSEGPFTVFAPTNDGFAKLPEGTVVEQLVEPTSLSQVYVKSGRSIGLRLSKKSQLVEMPSLMHKQVQFAQSILEQRGLRYMIQYKPSAEANGSVLDQRYNGRRIKEGERIPIGAVVILIVGQNDEAEPIALPNLLGLTMSEAKQIFDTLGVGGYTFICPDCLTSQDSAGALIFSQSPEYIEGTTVFKSTQFILSMQKGGGGQNP